MTQQDKARHFRQLHVPGRPLILQNVWDAGSAALVAEAGAAALGTSSWSIAAAYGLADGEKIDRGTLLACIGRIAAAVDLPLSADLESGYGEAPADVRGTVEAATAAGAIGCNLEDSFPETGKLRDAAAQAERLRQARAGAQAGGTDLFINARTDIFFQAPPETHDKAMAEAALERGRAYADAGADGLFVPGLSDLGLIAWLAERSPMPLNVMRLAQTPSPAELAAAGVARISHGPAPYLQAMAGLRAWIEASQPAAEAPAATPPRPAD